MSEASVVNERTMGDTLIPVRCPRCHRLACEAAAGSVVRVKCVRCGRLYELKV